MKEIRNSEENAVKNVRKAEPSLSKVREHKALTDRQEAKIHEVPNKIPTNDK